MNEYDRRLLLELRIAKQKAKKRVKEAVKELWCGNKKGKQTKIIAFSDTSQ